MQWEAPSELMAVDDPPLLPERKVYVEIGIDWFIDQDIPSHPQGGYVTIPAQSLPWEECLGRERETVFITYSYRLMM